MLCYLQRPSTHALSHRPLQHSLHSSCMLLKDARSCCARSGVPCMRNCLACNPACSSVARYNFVLPFLLFFEKVEDWLISHVDRLLCHEILHLAEKKFAFATVQINVCQCTELDVCIMGDVLWHTSVDFCLCELQAIHERWCRGEDGGQLSYAGREPLSLKTNQTRRRPGVTGENGGAVRSPAS